MSANEETLSFERPPLEGVPGLRAAGFRLLYKVLMRLKPALDRRLLRSIVHAENKARKRRWDETNASPKAGMFVTVVIWLLIGLCSALFTSRLIASDETESGDIVPRQRTNATIRDS